MKGKHGGATGSDHRRFRTVASTAIMVVVAFALLGLTWPPMRHAAINPLRGKLLPSPDSFVAANAPAPTATVPPRPTSTPASQKNTRSTTPAVSRSVAAEARKVPASLPKYLVLFVLDGARPDYFDVPNTPHLHALMKDGTRFTNAFAGILESETPSGHAAIASGSEPNQDGILSFDWAAGDNTTVDLFDPKAINDGQMEHIMKKAPAPTIGELVKAKYPKASVVALGGHKYYADDALGGPAADVIMYYTGTKDGHFVPVSVPGHVAPESIMKTPGLTTKTTSLPMGVEDKLVMRLVRTTVTHLQPEVLLVNMPEFDWPLGHVLGADRDPKGVAQLMQQFDKGLGKLEALYRKAGILDKTLFVVTADHGFAPIYHTVNKDKIDAAVQKAGTTVISDTYHTSGYMWLRDSSKSARAAANIAKLRDPGIQSVYFKSPQKNGQYAYFRASGGDLFLTPGMEGANQYLLQSFAGPNGPDVVAFYREDYASLPGGQANWKGDHGGADWYSQHMPLLIAGPGIRHGVVSNGPARIMDIAPTVLTLMNVAPTGMQGVPLADAMQHPSSAQVARRAATVKVLSPVISTLEREASLEVKNEK